MVLEELLDDAHRHLHLLLRVLGRDHAAVRVDVVKVACGRSAPPRARRSGIRARPLACTGDQMATKCVVQVVVLTSE